MTTDTLRVPALTIPSARTVWHLLLGGAAGFGIWEVFAATLTAWAAGFPLQPPELVKSLFEHQLGLTISTPMAELLHGFTGLIGYPVAYLVLSRLLPSIRMPAIGWIWGVITYFIALGLFAPLAGQPFLLLNVPILSFMSLIGHAIYGYIAVLVFETLERQTA
ncbi:MAG: DUF6789 family protein [Bosea sp. (in: a-proteobacteria)]